MHVAMLDNDDSTGKAKGWVARRVNIWIFLVGIAFGVAVSWFYAQYSYSSIPIPFKQFPEPGNVK